MGSCFSSTSKRLIRDIISTDEFKSLILKLYNEALENDVTLEEKVKVKRLQKKFENSKEFHNMLKKL
jgi:hypothetical protein